MSLILSGGEVLRPGKETVSHSIELAVYEAKDPERFGARQIDLHRSIAELMPGYVTSVALRSATEANVFVDLVVWEDHAAATAASEKLPHTPELAWLHDELATIRFFGHLDPTDGTADVVATVAEVERS